MTSPDAIAALIALGIAMALTGLVVLLASRPSDAA
jgi:hypothetical protein